MTNARDRKRRREIELAAQVRSIFERLPASALLMFLRNLQEAAVLAEDETEVVDTSPHVDAVTGVSWSKLAGALVPTPAEIATERRVSLSDGDGRLDLVVPVPLIEILKKPVGSIVFEFKLNPRNVEQLTAYSASLPNSLVISVSAGEDIPPIERSSSTGQYWLCQTWEHLYFSLRELLSADASSRVPPLAKEPDSLLLKFDHKVAAQDRLSFICEDLLQAIQEEGLLPNRDLTLVVPVGAPAQRSLDESPPFYAHPKAWQSGYRYVATVRGNVLQHLYEVEETAYSDSSTRGDGPSRIRPDFWDELCNEELRVSILEQLPDEPPAGLKYVKKGPNGRLNTFTFSHRYLENPGELKKYFTETVG